MNVIEIVRVSNRRPPQDFSGTTYPPLKRTLQCHEEVRALSMFRDELRDTKEIAWRLEATEAVVANGIARARERERQWR
jgi:hypothetical protein